MKPSQKKLLTAYLPLLKHMAKCRRKDCENIVKGLSNEVIRVICQIAVNVMNKNIPIKTPSALAKLSRYKTQLKAVTKPKSTLPQKRKVLEQDGGFLGTLLGVALPPLISGLVSRFARSD